MQPTSTSELGIGRPSKYCDLPVLSFGMRATVALKRARRAIPQQMKAVRAMMSAVLRSPIANPRKAGATPNEIWATRSISALKAGEDHMLTESARLSSSCPSMLVSFLHLATLPSKKSNSMPASGAHKAILRNVHVSSTSKFCPTRLSGHAKKGRPFHAQCTPMPKD